MEIGLVPTAGLHAGLHVSVSGQQRPDAAAASVTADASTISPETELAAREFEAMVLAQFLAPLFDGIETPGIAGGGQSEKIFGAMMQQEYAKAMADAGGVGIADSVLASLIDLQTSTHPASSHPLTSAKGS